MPEEAPPVIDPISTQLSNLDGKLDTFRADIQAEIKELRLGQQALREGVAELKGGFVQIQARFEKVDREIKDVQLGQQAIREDMAELKGGFGQMDRRQGDLISRLENVERNVSQIQWGMVSGFLVTILAVLLTKLL